MIENEGLLYHLSLGPKAIARTWPAYFVNGYNFHTQEYGKGKATMNSGVCVQSGSSLMEAFYGLLDAIIQVEYPGPPLAVTLFKCTWFDPIKGMRVHPKFNLVEVNHKRKYMKYEPFVLAQQAIQVYYASYPSLKQDKVEWWAACKIKARKKIEQHWKDTAYQQEVVLHTAEPYEYNIPSLQDPHGALIDVDASEVRQSNLHHSVEEDEFITDDDEDTDEENEDTEDEDEFYDHSEDAEDDDYHDNDEDDNDNDFGF